MAEHRHTSWDLHESFRQGTWRELRCTAHLSRRRRKAVAPETLTHTLSRCKHLAFCLSVAFSLSVPLLASTNHKLWRWCIVKMLTTLQKPQRLCFSVLRSPRRAAAPPRPATLGRPLHHSHRRLQCGLLWSPSHAAAQGPDQCMNLAR